jgi:hypothetical protein
MRRQRHVYHRDAGPGSPDRQLASADSPGPFALRNASMPPHIIPPHLAKFGELDSKFRELIAEIRVGRSMPPMAKLCNNLGRS